MRFEQRLLAARSHDDAADWVDLDPVVVQQLLGNRLAQSRDAGTGDVVRVAGIHRLDRRVADVLGGDEIGIAAAEIDDVDPLGLQLAGAVGDGQRRRRGQIRERGW